MPCLLAVNDDPVPLIRMDTEDAGQEAAQVAGLATAAAPARARKPRRVRSTHNGWEETRLDGVLTITLKSWRNFGDCFSERFLSIADYVYRGQADYRWRLTPLLDRLLKRHPRYPDINGAVIERRHLETFKMAVRGRRGPHPPLINDEDDWWALGQHHGLATPLLDWTRSPYVAAYFAFASPERMRGQRYRCVFGLQLSLIEELCQTGVTGVSGRIVKTRNGLPMLPEDRVRHVRPYSDENARLVSQAGLFTRSPAGEDIERWVRRHFRGVPKGLLAKILIPDSDREECLRSLNRMNINHLTLFPDLYGASKYCNHAVILPDYD